MTLQYKARHGHVMGTSWVITTKVDSANAPSTMVQCLFSSTL